METIEQNSPETQEIKCKICGKSLMNDTFGERCEDCYSIGQQKSEMLGDFSLPVDKISTFKSNSEERDLKNSDERKKSKPGGKKKET